SPSGLLVTTAVARIMSLDPCEFVHRLLELRVDVVGGAAHDGTGSGGDAAAIGCRLFFLSTSLNAVSSCALIAFQFETTVFSSPHPFAYAFVIDSVGAMSPKSSVSS